jgi:predicted membrane protein
MSSATNPLSTGPVFGWASAVISSFVRSYVTHNVAVEVNGTVLSAYLYYLLSYKYIGSSAVP